MFYPEQSLKRGGRFYLCWVADSWPLRFATITHRQLWSQDIRKICDDLAKVITNESGRPDKRFSLRLSSQLLRGLVRLYHKKVSGFLDDLCMINATVFKHANKKWHIHDMAPEARPTPQLPQLQQLDIETAQEAIDNVQRVEEMIQNSGNVVSNIEDITLKESAIPELMLPPNDGFGEEHPGQPLQLLQDRTLEMMLAAPDTSAALSGLEAALNEHSHDKSRLAPHDAPLMEAIDEHDLTLFRKSTGAELVADFEKDIPEIPEIPIPDLLVPPVEKPQEMPAEVVAPPEFPAQLTLPPVPEAIRQQELPEIELEELEERVLQPKRRRLRNKLIIDKHIKLSTNFLRSRIDNPLVDLRCEDSSDDIIQIRVPPEVYFRRPCHAGPGITNNIGFEFSRLFMRNLGVINSKTRIEREMETPMQGTRRPTSRLVLERIDEEPESAVPNIAVPPQVEAQQPADVSAAVVMPAERVSVDPMELDITEMLTQKVMTLSQETRKRAAELETAVAIKRQRSGFMSFSGSQRARETEGVPTDRTTRVEPQLFEMDLDANKENIPDNIPQPRDAEQILSGMLQEAGLADIQPQPIDEEPRAEKSQARRESRRTGSESSETPLGSLDRTKVSLGDSEQTTDSKRFIRDQWGTEGTMIKILKFIKTGLKPVTVDSLIAKGPVISGHRRVIAARCFTSLLKLKQHGFINIRKDAGTLAIVDITLGPRLTKSNEQF